MYHLNMYKGAMVNHFPCWNSACKNELSLSWEEVEDDISGRMAYCSEGCFEEDCKRESDHFNSAYSLVNLTKPYVVGDSASEAALFSALQLKNSYITHSVEEEEADRFAGNWHYIWVPDLEELKEFAEEIKEEGQDIKNAMGNIDYSEWEEFLVFTHPVKGIALIQTYNRLSNLSISVYVSKGNVEMDTAPSNPNLIDD